MPIPRMLVKVLSAAVLLSGLGGPLELTAGAESPRPPAGTSTSPAGNPQATQPVAAWDVVPFQVFDKPFHVGVVAFHETGCKVEFTVRTPAGEPAARTQAVENPTLNAQSNVWGKRCISQGFFGHNLRDSAFAMT